MSGCRPSSFSSREEDTESNLSLDISSARRPRTTQRFRNYCDKTFTLSKGSYLILTLNFLMYIPLSISIITRFNTLYIVDKDIRNTLISCYFLLYPFLALLGDRFIRYRVVLVGTILIAIGTAIFIFIKLLVNFYYHSNSGITLLLLSYVFYLPVYFGFALFQSNIIQLGTDQLLFASSIQLRYYIYWQKLTIYLPSLFILLIYIIMITLGQSVHITLITLVLYIFAILTTVAGLLMLCFIKQHIVIEPPPTVNPAKQIYNIFKYSIKYKRPLQRSAFTYGEAPPGMLDRVKERYGGPFTTDQVEDVRSFKNILLILLSLFGYHFNESTAGIAREYIKLFNMTIDTNDTKISFNLMESIVLVFPNSISVLIIVVGILCLQYVIFPFCSHKLPKMLKRIGLGLFLSSISSLLQVIFCVFLEIEQPLPHELLILPQFLNGISGFLFLTIYEFIIAQAPYHMQGLLIGILYSQMSIKYVSLDIALNSDLGHNWLYYTIKSLMVLLSLLLYCFVSWQYRQRQRDESSTINERVIIEEYWERALNRKDAIKEVEYIEMY